MKVILITGASGGIGFATAKRLVRAGHTVYGTTRSYDHFPKLKQSGIIPMKMDVTNPDDINRGVQEVIADQSRLDVLINNAGYGSYGTIENVPMSEVKKQFEVNLFGVARLTKAVLPIMRHQKSGKIINISSVGGRVVTYMGAWYHATKYALEAFSDALRMEMAPFNIQVVLVEPGGIKTPWGVTAANHLMRAEENGPYHKQAFKVAKRMKKVYSSNLLSEPSVVAEAINKAIDRRNPKARYLVGSGARSMILMKDVLPTKIFDAVIKKIM
ncbi:short-chain dehydrogenase/reductase [Philodulcilactobacillus myokoensis]|uniref:Short-chain dehydrogenase/reductase n=1 Tax=Philodulcilactobacillus myokoensis TaxID=2929573 RepID=A0A9W6ETE3_9LACO|nr:oxidoreductase [Philodulcilactobacillus myokoensis]GLB47615.1 short-chain dehydrogenase/reductase [Philodulcilactobacillus myokoensis]